MVSRVILIVNVVLGCLVIAALFNLSVGDVETVDIRRRLARGGGSRGGSSRSSSSRSSSSRSSSSSSSSTSNYRSTGGATTNSYYRASYTPTTSTYTPTRTYRSASTYTYTGRNAQTIDNTATYSYSPTQYTTLYRSTSSADYYKTGGIPTAVWFGYQSYYYGAYYSNCYYCYRHNDYRYTSSDLPPERQLFTFVETSCALHGCVALNETDACLNATKNIPNAVYQQNNSTATGMTYCVAKIDTSNATATTTMATYYAEATTDVCSVTYPCLCSCLVTLVDTAGAGSVSIVLVGMLLAFLMF